LIVITAKLRALSVLCVSWLASGMTSGSAYESLRNAKLCTRCTRWPVRYIWAETKPQLNWSPLEGGIGRTKLTYYWSPATKILRRAGMQRGLE